MHKGQWASAAGVLPSDPSALSVTFNMPAALHSISSCCGLTMGDATATPSVNANQSRAILASQGEVRRVWKTDMGRDYALINHNVNDRWMQPGALANARA